MERLEEKVKEQETKWVNHTTSLLLVIEGKHCKHDNLNRARGKHSFQRLVFGV